ncbi:MAG TPA: hypothetical protein H9903_18625 [Candidatus Aquabacterium excrementipullorum]|nr:hypothetical protein [Candidatus Aquabacterium excrementipullorum]
MTLAAMKAAFALTVLAVGPAWADVQISEAQAGSVTARTIRAVAKGDLRPSAWPGFIDVVVSSAMITRQTMSVNVRNIQEVVTSEEGVSVILGQSSSRTSPACTTTFWIPRTVMDKDAALDMFRQAADER